MQACPSSGSESNRRDELAFSAALPRLSCRSRIPDRGICSSSFRSLSGFGCPVLAQQGRVRALRGEGPSLARRVRVLSVLQGVRIPQAALTGIKPPDRRQRSRRSNPSSANRRPRRMPQPARERRDVSSRRHNHHNYRVRGENSLMRRVASRPSPPGITMSISTTSGLYRWSHPHALFSIASLKNHRNIRLRLQHAPQKPAKSIIVINDQNFHGLPQTRHSLSRIPPSAPSQPHRTPRPRSPICNVYLCISYADTRPRQVALAAKGVVLQLTLTSCYTKAVLAIEWIYCCS